MLGVLSITALSSEEGSGISGEQALEKLLRTELPKAMFEDVEQW